jgi:hypothetical protein
MGTGILPSVVKRPELEAYISDSSSVDVNNVWSFTSRPISLSRYGVCKQRQLYLPFSPLPPKWFPIEIIYAFPARVTWPAHLILHFITLAVDLLFSSNTRLLVGRIWMASSRSLWKFLLSVCINSKCWLPFYFLEHEQSHDTSPKRKDVYLSDSWALNITSLAPVINQITVELL